MKKKVIRLVAVVAGLLLLSSIAFATNYTATVTPGMGIKGTAHDLSIIGATAAGRSERYGSNDRGNAYLPGGDLDRICVWCHAPHHTYKNAGGSYGGSVTYYPLWNHKVTALTFTGYTAGTELPNEMVDDGAGGQVAGNHASQTTDTTRQPGGVSKLCLSCHDGSVAVNEYGFAPGDEMSSGVRKGDAPVTISAQYKIGGSGDLSNHHPIGFNYATVANLDDEIASPDKLMTDSNSIGDLLYGGKMECVTCHDVHNTKNTGEKFLWKSDFQSQFCLTCHLKADEKKG